MVVKKLGFNRKILDYHRFYINMNLAVSEGDISEGEVDEFGNETYENKWRFWSFWRMEMVTIEAAVARRRTSAKISDLQLGVVFLKYLV